MTDATLATGDLSSAENLSTDLHLIANDTLDAASADEALVAEPEVPNGFSHWAWRPS